MRNVLSFLFVVFIFTSVSSQNVEINSLLIKLENTNIDTAKIVILNDLALGLYNSSPVESNDYAKRAYQISVDNNYTKHLTNTYGALAVSNWVLGNLEIALEQLIEKSIIQIKQNNSKGVLVTKYQIALILKSSDNMETALRYLNEILEVESQIENILFLATVYSEVGVINYKLGNANIAKEYWLKSSKIFIAENQEERASLVENNIANLYLEKEEWDSALEIYLESFRICKKYRNNRAMVTIANNIGNIYQAKVQFSLAREYFTLAMDTARFYMMHNAKQASLLFLIDIDTLQGDYKNALKYYIEYYKFEDSVFSQERQQKVSELRIKYETDAKSYDIEILQKSDKINVLWIHSIFSISILLILVIIFLWRLVYQKQKNNQILYEKNEKISEQKEEINVIANELQKNSEKLEIFNVQLKTKNIDLLKSIEETEKIQKQLVQSEKMASLGVLSAGIAHELNNPINFINIGVGNLIRDLQDLKPVVDEVCNIHPESTNIKEKLERIRKLKIENEYDEAYSALPVIIKDIKLGIDRSVEIVKSLRSFSRTDEGEFQMFHIHEAIETSLVLLRSKYKDRVEIIKDLSDEVVEIECLASDINQVFINLISNAIDAISFQGKVTISTKLDSEMIQISIKDTGKGIPKDLQSRVFDPFFTRKPIGEGIGMGLYLVYGIIQNHYGSIRLISEDENGSEFIIKLPIKQN